MQRKYRQSIGFTLIELLFVIAILGVLASLGVSMMQKRTENFKVQRTALQMQHILQAGMSWNVDNNGDWPDCGDTKDNNSDFYKNYIGDNIITVPWGTEYHWCRTDKYPTPEGDRFYVDAKAPDNITAKHIAALLPSADICTDNSNHNGPCDVDSNTGTWVRGYVNIPGQAIQGGIIIKKYGTVSVSLENTYQSCQDSDNITFNCPLGMSGDLIFGLARYHHYGHVQMNSPKNGDEADVYVNNDNCSSRSNNGTITCRFSLCTNDNKKSPGHTTIDATMSYIAICVNGNKKA
jgi:prepilin-type N-terminal cleavage/methylation domain-containing protein